MFHRKKRSVTVTRVLNYINSYVSEIVARTIRKCDDVCTPRCDKNASASKSVGITSERYFFLISSVKTSSTIELILFSIWSNWSIEFFRTRMSKQSGKYKYPLKENDSTKEKRKMDNVYCRSSNFTSMSRFSFFFPWLSKVNRPIKFIESYSSILYCVVYEPGSVSV